MYYEDSKEFAKQLAQRIMEQKRLQECMPMPMNSMGEGEKSESEDEPGEYDYEGDMAKSQLRSIAYNSKMLHDMLEDNTNLPEWVQSKITLAEDYIMTAANYMRGEMMNEEVVQIEEGFKKSSPAHMKARNLVSRSSMKVVYHSDGSATIYTTGDENVSSATKVDHIHRDAGLDYNKPASAYENSSTSKGGLKFKTKETDDGSHQVHISYKGMKEEVEQIDEGADHWVYSGTVNGKEYAITIPRGADLSDHLDLEEIQSENPHLEPHEVKAVADTSGEDEDHVEVEHDGEKYTSKLYAR